MHNRKHCPICNSERILFRFKIEDYFCKIPGIFEMHCCEDCEGYFLNPYLSQEELKPYYTQNYYAFRCKPSVGIYQRMKIINPLAYWNAMWNRINVRNIKTGWGRSTFSNAEGKLLDIGCGDGKYLRFLRKGNPDLQLFGCDAFFPDWKDGGDTNINYAKKDFTEAAYPSSFFDYITINHVLEHFSDPNIYIDEAYRVLKKGGMLTIGVPVSDSLHRKVFNKYWNGFDAPRHMANFSQQNLCNLLVGRGFAITKTRRIGTAQNAVESILFRFPNNSFSRRFFENSLVRDLMKAVLSPIVFMEVIFNVSDLIELQGKKN